MSAEGCNEAFSSSFLECIWCLTDDKLIFKAEGKNIACRPSTGVVFSDHRQRFHV
jgi:hypothetical protein